MTRNGPRPRGWRRVAAAVGVVGLVSTVGVGAAGATRVIELAIREGKLAAADRTLVVAQHSDLELRWRSDRPVDLHLHGYGLQVRVAPDRQSTLAFKARLAGRFPISDHGADGRQHRVVGYLEVHP